MTHAERLRMSRNENEWAFTPVDSKDARNFILLNSIAESLADIADIICKTDKHKDRSCEGCKYIQTSGKSYPCCVCRNNFMSMYQERKHEEYMAESEGNG